MKTALTFDSKDILIEALDTMTKERLVEITSEIVDDGEAVVFSFKVMLDDNLLPQ